MHQEILPTSTSHHPPLCFVLVLPRRRCALKVRGCHLSTACGPQQSTSGISTSTCPSPSWADCWLSIFKHRRWYRWVEQVSGISRYTKVKSHKQHQISELFYLRVGDWHCKAFVEIVACWQVCSALRIMSNEKSKLLKKDVRLRSSFYIFIFFIFLYIFILYNAQVLQLSRLPFLQINIMANPGITWWIHIQLFFTVLYCVFSISGAIVVMLLFLSTNITPYMQCICVSEC